MKKITVIFLFAMHGNSQTKKLTLNGYLKDLGMYYKPVFPIQVSESDSLDFLFLNQIHNRLNFKWYATNSLTFALEARNCLFFGQMIVSFRLMKIW